MKTELLSPAGSFEGLKAVINAGADAVYLGGKKFGARAYAENFDENSLIEAIRYAHIFGVAVHMTVNTVLKEDEAEELISFLKPYYEAGLDAVIVQDLGAVEVIRKNFPELQIHLSTQLSVCGPETVNALKEKGISRVVVSRELSLEEISSIRESTGAEIETFIHGALCYCYSGRCLFSSFLGGRSGNRGRCAQPCRLEYDAYYNDIRINGKKEKYLLSPKDICTLDILPELIKSGIASFKIEGRMKKPEYAAGVTSIYRKYIDLFYRDPDNYRVDENDKKFLYDLFNR
ncbi:MAG: peptidase U32 family protein, partial [Lachnospiraceae bacterium]